MRFLPAIFATLVLMTVLSSHIISGADSDESTRGTDVLLWDENTFLDENITVAANQKLVISPGVNITFGLDVYLTVKGEITCGTLDGAAVNFLNGQERLSGGLVLINCPGASFRNTLFSDLSLALEAIYTVLELDNCTFNNTGVGIFAHECEITMSNCTFSNCDMASRFSRSDVSAGDCVYRDNLQSLMMHSELELIESFYHFELEKIERSNPDITWPVEADADIRGCEFIRTGVGASAISLASLTIEDCEFLQCKKGLHATLSPGWVKGCSFTENKADYEINGRDLEVRENVTEPLNYTLYFHYDLSLQDDDGEPVPRINVIVTHPELMNATYITDERGEIGSLVLLRERSRDGNRTLYEGYELVVESEDFEGYYPLGDEGSFVITPGDMMGGDENVCAPVADEACYVLLGVLVFLLLIGIVWGRFDRKKE